MKETPSEAVVPLAPAVDLAADTRLHEPVAASEPVAEAEAANSGHRRFGDVSPRPRSASSSARRMNVASIIRRAG